MAHDLTTSRPQHHPTFRELQDLELLTTGMLSPLRKVNHPGSPVTLSLPADLTGREVEIVDAEGLPLAVVAADGTVEPLTHAQHGPFRDLYLSVEQVRARYAGRTFVAVADPLTQHHLAALRGFGAIVLVALAGEGTASLSPVALLRATKQAAAMLPVADVVAVPLAAHGDAAVDHDLGTQILENLAQGDPIHALPEGDDDYPDEIARIIDEDQPPADEQGLVLFFTGLSGSGKSTLAQALMDRLLEQGGRTVTSLDGDVVRRSLSAGLTFSKEDRETNIRRIVWVAAEIARHRGIAVCSPIAPFDQTRQQVRAMVEAAGGAFFLIHVATPLAECERRDRKGLYVKARRGEIPEFTGISSPYEEPQDADVRVDTTRRSVTEALGDVLVALRDEGYIDLLGDEAPSPAPTDEPSSAPQGAAVHSPDHPLRVLFVCTANICRSPSMELMARALVGDGTDLAFASAGTHGFVDHEMDATMAAAVGEDASGFRSRRIERPIIDSADLILTAEAAHRKYIIEEFPGAFRKVFTIGQFVRDTAGRPERGWDLLAYAAEHRTAVDKSLDVADPYRKGSAAAATARDEIDRLVTSVVQRLSASS